MKKFLSVILVVVMALCIIPSAALAGGSSSKATYDLTGCKLAIVKQAKGAVIWVESGDKRSDSEIILAAKGQDPSLINGTDYFTVLRGNGTCNTPNQKGAQAKVTVNGCTLTIEGDYSHFNEGETAGTTTAAKTTKAEETTKATETNPTQETTSVEETSSSTEEEEEEDPEIIIVPENPNPTNITMYVTVPKGMAVRFSDGTVYYGGEQFTVEEDKEYYFQMCSTAWDPENPDQTGKYVDGGEIGYLGSVVYTMKVVNENVFRALVLEYEKDTTGRYTIKGQDIIDNVTKTIIINGGNPDCHLETDVNNCFMAYRFHFTQDFNHGTAIPSVVNKPIESLSVNLPLGATVPCYAYSGVYTDTLTQIGQVDLFIQNNDGTGVYEDEFLTSVNDYYWVCE